MNKNATKDKQRLLKTKTREWQSLRRRVFRRDGNQCVKCGTKKHLQCHHRYYLTGRLYWDYPLTAFLTLCDTCHVEFHKETPGKNLVVAKADEKAFMAKEGVHKYDKRKQYAKSNPNKKVSSPKNETRTTKLIQSMTPKEKEIQARYDKLRKLAPTPPPIKEKAEALPSTTKKKKVKKKNPPQIPNIKREVVGAAEYFKQRVLAIIKRDYKFRIVKETEVQTVYEVTMFSGIKITVYPFFDIVMLTDSFIELPCNVGEFFDHPSKYIAN